MIAKNGEKKLSTFLREVAGFRAFVVRPNRHGQNCNAAGQPSRHPERRNANIMEVDRIRLRPLDASQKPIRSTVNPPK